MAYQGGLALDVRLDTRDIERKLNHLQKRQIPFATSVALNKTANRAAKKIEWFASQVFDKPTAKTRKPVWVEYSHGGIKHGMTRIQTRKYGKRLVTRYLTAKVGLKEYNLTQDPWLLVHITGGARPLKRSEKRLGNAFTMGKDAKRNKFGNLTKGTYGKILADLQKYGYTDSAGNTKTRAAGGDKKIKYFMRRHSRGMRIVYQKGGTKKEPTITPILVESTKGKPRYRKRFPFYKAVRGTVAKHYPNEFRAALAHALATAR